ncbi:alpha-L-fucosidase [Sphingomonas sp. MMS24-JH45]
MEGRALGPGAPDGPLQAGGGRIDKALANHHDDLDTYPSRHHPWNTMRVGPGRTSSAPGRSWRASRRSLCRLDEPFGPCLALEPARLWLRSRGAARRAALRCVHADEGAGPRQMVGRARSAAALHRSSHADARRHPHLDKAGAWHAATDGLSTEGVPGEQRLRPHLAAPLSGSGAAIQPDMVYFDNVDLPLEQYGLDFTAWYYNQSMQWNGGKLDVVVTGKLTPPQRRMGIVDDVERGGKTYIERFPWQTDTCIGAWHYNRDVYERGAYKSAATVIHTLCDVVSKNGNLMLNVPMRADGADRREEEERIVDDIADWMGRYGKAIYGTRP